MLKLFLAELSVLAVGLAVLGASLHYLLPQGLVALRQGAVGMVKGRDGRVIPALTFILGLASLTAMALSVWTITGDGNIVLSDGLLAAVPTLSTAALYPLGMAGLFGLLDTVRGPRPVETGPEGARDVDESPATAIWLAASIKGQCDN